MPIVSLKAKVLYFIWKKRGVEANYNNLSRALGYQDDRRIRDAVNESLEDGTLSTKARNGKDYWVTTNKAEGTIGVFILPLTQEVVLVVVGVVVLLAGLQEYYFRYRVPALSLTGLGVLVIAVCGGFWYLQRRLERRIWEVERRKTS